MKLCTSLCLSFVVRSSWINWFIHSLPSSVCSLTRASITDVFRKPPDRVFPSNSGFLLPIFAKWTTCMEKFVLLSMCQGCFLSRFHAKGSLHVDAWQPLMLLQKEVGFRHRETREITRIWIRCKNSHLYDMTHMKLSKKDFHNQNTHAKVEWRRGTGN